MSDIIPVNSSDGFTPYLIGFYVNTEHGWVGAYDKRAIESMIAAVREKALHEAAIEIERLQERCTEQAHWIDAAVSKCATQQCSRRAAQLLELQAEIERLRAALEKAHDVWETEATEMRDEIERLRNALAVANFAAGFTSSPLPMKNTAAAVKEAK